MNYKTFSVMALAVSLFSITPAYASGGSGDGGGSVGSGASQPSYDPVKEYQAGVEYLRAEEYRKADRSFAKVLKVTKRHAQTNYYMGLAKVGQEKHKSATRYFKTAVKYNKTMYEAYGGLGAAYANSDKLEKAQGVLTELDGLAVSCGDCAQASGIKGAQDVINAAINGTAKKAAFLSPYDSGVVGTQYFASVALINKGEFQTAFNDLTLTTAAAGPHPDITTYMGYTQRKMGNYDLAKTYYALALDVDPNHKGANEYLGELYVETGEMNKAKAQLVKLENICTFGCIEENELRSWIVDALP